MPFDPDQTAAPFHYLAAIALTGFTWRVADVDLVLSDGTWWEGRLIPSQTTIRRTLGSLTEAKYVAQSFSIALSNQDDAVRTKFSTYQWANRTVTVYIGHGTTAGDYTELARGVIRFPGGTSYLQDTAVIVCDDPREKHELKLPVNRLDPATYPNMETKSQYKPIPLVYGDWTSGVGGGLKVQAYQIDSTVGTGGSFKWAGTAQKQLEAVYKNGVSVAFSATNLTNATFTLDVAYTPSTDTITVNCKGATDDGTSGGTLLENPALILKDILKTHLGLTDSDLDLAAFSDYQSNASSDVCRRWIGGTQESSSSLISQLLNETWCDLTISGNQYKPAYRLVSISGSPPTYYDYDIMKSGVGAAARSMFQVIRDPDRLYANRMIGSYQYDPIDGEFDITYTFNDTAAQADVLTIRQRDLNFYWLYTASPVQSRVEREVFTFGSAEIEMVSISLLQRAILKGPTDQFRLIFDKYGDGATGIGDPFQIRSSEIALGRLANPVTAWNMLNLSPGRWTDTSAPTWLLSNISQRQTQGYWTDANGYADPSGSPDPTSKRSRWF